MSRCWHIWTSGDCPFLSTKNWDAEFVSAVERRDAECLGLVSLSEHNKTWRVKEGVSRRPWKLPSKTSPIFLPFESSNFEKEGAPPVEKVLCKGRDKPRTPVLYFHQAWRWNSTPTENFATGLKMRGLLPGLVGYEPSWRRRLQHPIVS